MATVVKRGSTWIVTTEFSYPATTYTVSRDGAVTRDTGPVKGPDILLVVNTLSDAGLNELAGRVHGWWSTGGPSR